MYFKILAGFDVNKELTEQEQNKVTETVNILFKEFMNEYTPRTSDKGSFDLIETETDGYVFRFTSNTKRIGTENNIYEDYFVSAIEFGGVRKNENDHRFNSNWKLFMLTKLNEINSDVVEQYFNEWNDKFVKHEANARGVSVDRIEEKDSNVEYNCRIGEFLLNSSLEQ